MTTYTMPVPTRTQWQQLRDKNKVAKGAAKVSIGDAIDPVHSTFSLNTLSKHQAAVGKLEKDVDAYLLAIKTKYPAFVPVMTKAVKNKIVSHKRFVADLVKAKTEYYPRHHAVTEAVKKLKLRGEGRPKDIAKAMERLLGCLAAFALVDQSWEGKRQALNRLMGECDGATTLSQQDFARIDKVMTAIEP